MNKNKVISIGFVTLAALLGISLSFFGNSTFVLGIFCLAMYVYYSFLIAPNQKRFLNIKEALKSTDLSNEELSSITQVDPEKINLLRVDNDFTEEELKSLAVALDVKEDRSSQMNAKRIIFIVLGVILTVVLVYFLFGEA
ncbi:hypothetical protein KQI58_00545 [Enterococcus raffinosus]|uniref:hypothetical protein n=1 Tax=Enterococcus raffinosus TaxID=71452 RepID=UPI001C11A5B9|nr:hypothetical protein [Enterococcus raffinosus]MBU5359559.1 hypothetical protein [Enterococcus raffinosus]